MIVRERLKSSLRKFYGRYGDLSKRHESPLSQLFQDTIIFSDTFHWYEFSLYRDIDTALDLSINVDALRVSIFMTSPLGESVGLMSI